jgi:hypothetical protein
MPPVFFDPLTPTRASDDILELDLARPRALPADQRPSSRAELPHWLDLTEPAAPEALSPQKRTEASELIDEEEEEPSQSASAVRWEEQFRAIGETVFERFWPEVRTEIPRMTRESRLIVEMRPSRYEKLRDRIEESTRRTPGTPPKLRFSRRIADLE